MTEEGGGAAGRLPPRCGGGAAVAGAGCGSGTGSISGEEGMETVSDGREKGRWGGGAVEVERCEDEKAEESAAKNADEGGGGAGMSGVEGREESDEKIGDGGRGRLLFELEELVEEERWPSKCADEKGAGPPAKG